MSIRTRLIVTYVLISGIAILFISVVHFTNSRKALITAKLGELESIANLKVAIINSFFSDLRNNLGVSRDSYNIRRNLPILTRNIGNPSGDAFRAATAMLDAQLPAWNRERGDIDDLMLLAPDGRVVYSSAGFRQQEKFGQLRYDAGSVAFTNGESGVFFGSMFMITGADRDLSAIAARQADHDFYATAPIKDKAGNFAGEIAMLVDARKLLMLAINDVKGLEGTGEIAVSMHVPGSAADPRRHTIIFSSMRHGIDPANLGNAFLVSTPDLPSSDTYEGGEGSGEALDYRGADVLAAWRHVSPLNLELAVKIDLSEALIPTSTLKNAAWFLGIITLLLVTVISMIFSRSVTEPVNHLISVAKRFGVGDLTPAVAENLIVAQDEVGLLARAFDAMAARLRASYAGLEQKVSEKTAALQQSLSDFERQNEELNKSRNALKNVVKDLNIEKTFSEENAKELQKFRMAVEGASDHIIITDTDGYIIYTNKAAEKITGYSRAEMLGKRPSLWGGLMPKEFYANLWETIKVKKQPFEAEIDNKRKDGALYIAHTNIIPVLDINGNVLFFVGIERDITKEKEIDRAKTEFISLATHQLRTPLTTMKWIPEMLLDGGLGKIPAKQRKYIEDIHRSANKLITLINQLLDISRIESRRLDLNIEDVSVAKIFDALRDDFAHEAKLRRHHLVFRSPEPEVLRTDRRLLGEVARNLISNAVKYTPNGGRIEVALQPLRNGFVRLSVKDNGIGIPQKQQQHIFEKFFRADNAIKVDVSGTGLGLHIIRDFAAVLGGTVTFESREGKGSTFFVDLPVAGPPPQVT